MEEAAAEVENPLPAVEPLNDKDDDGGAPLPLAALSTMVLCADEGKPVEADVASGDGLG